MLLLLILLFIIWVLLQVAGKPCTRHNGVWIGRGTGRGIGRIRKRSMGCSMFDGVSRDEGLGQVECMGGTKDIYPWKDLNVLRQRKCLQGKVHVQSCSCTCAPSQMRSLLSCTSWSCMCAPSWMHSLLSCPCVFSRRIPSRSYLLCEDGCDLNRNFYTWGPCSYLGGRCHLKFADYRREACS